METQTFDSKADALLATLTLDERCAVTEQVVLNLGNRLTDETYLEELERLISE